MYLIKTISTISAPEVMDPIQKVKPKDSQTLIVEFNMVTGATHYIVRIQSYDGFYREDTIYSSPAEISSLTPYTAYTLSIMAVNSGGRNQHSPSVTGKTGTVFLISCLVTFIKANNTENMFITC